MFFLLFMWLWVLGKSYIMNPVAETTLVAQSVVLLVSFIAFANWNMEITFITLMCNKLNCITWVPKSWTSSTITTPAWESCLGCWNTVYSGHMWLCLQHIIKGKYFLTLWLFLSQVHLCLQVWEGLLLPCLHLATAHLVRLPLASREDHRCLQGPLVSRHAFLWEHRCRRNPNSDCWDELSFG